MAVFRVEKTGNFTVMANHHLRDKNLSLKAKGLLSMFLSLPETWSYSIKGLARICKEGVDAIRTALKELIQAGYVVCSRKRNAMGQLKEAEYMIYEKPQAVVQPESEEDTGAEAEDAPAFSSSVLAKPAQEQPVLEKPTLGTPPQINNNILSPTGMDTRNSVTPKKKINKNTTKGNPYPSNPYQSQAAWVCEMPKRGPAMSYPTGARNDRSDEIISAVKKRIGYEALSQEYGQDLMDEVLDVILRVKYLQRGTVRVDQGEYPVSFVQRQFNRLNSQHVIEVLENMKKTVSRITDPVQYLTTCLFKVSMSLTISIDAKMRYNDYRQAQSAVARAEEAAMDDLMEVMESDIWEELQSEKKRKKGTETAKNGNSLPVSPAFGGYRDHDVFSYCAG